MKSFQSVNVSLLQGPCFATVEEDAEYKGGVQLLSNVVVNLLASQHSFHRSKSAGGRFDAFFNVKIVRKIGGDIATEVFEGVAVGDKLVRSNIEISGIFGSGFNSSPWDVHGFCFGFDTSTFDTEMDSEAKFFEFFVNKFHASNGICSVAKEEC